MTNTKGFSISLLLAAAVLSQPVLAAEQIKQRTTESGSVELSNLDGPDASAPIVQVDKPAAAGTPAAAAPVVSAAARPVLARASKRKSVTETPDPENADALAEEATPAAEANEMAAERAPSEAATERQQAKASDNPALPAGNGAYAGNGGGYAGGAAAGAAAAAADTGSAATGSGSGSGTGTAAADPTLATPSKPYVAPVITAPPGFDPTVAAQLASYRALMLQEATFTSLSNTNPATSRRYLAVDRVTYQARIGK